MTRRVGALSTMLIGDTVGMLALLAAAIALQEPLPSSSDLMWGVLAGLLGMIGLGFLLRGFAAGRMGIVAPVSATLSTAIPVVFAAFTQGLPRSPQLLGFGVGLASIWMLSRPERLGGRPEGLGMALLAGTGFGGFYIALGQIGGSAVLWPLVSGRLAAAGVLLIVVLLARRRLLPSGAPLGLLSIVGLLDAGGNLFFLLAVQGGRLDVASVLGSFYPAVTAVLAWVIAGERMSTLQVAGVTTAVLAIGLITV